MKVQTEITLLLTYDDKEIGNPGSEWDWHTLLNADGGKSVEVQIVDSEVIWRAK